MRRPSDKRQKEPDVSEIENTPPAKKARNERAGDEHQCEQNYQECIDELHVELMKEHPKKKAVRRLMKATFAGRRQWIKRRATGNS